MTSRDDRPNYCRIFVVERIRYTICALHAIVNWWALHAADRLETSQAGLNRKIHSCSYHVTRCHDNLFERVKPAARWSRRTQVNEVIRVNSRCRTCIQCQRCVQCSMRWVDSTSCMVVTSILIIGISSSNSSSSWVSDMVTTSKTRHHWRHCQLTSIPRGSGGHRSTWALTAILHSTAQVSPSSRYCTSLVPCLCKSQQMSVSATRHNIGLPDPTCI